MDVKVENQIIASVQQGCIEEFEHLVRLYQGPLFRVVGNLVNPPHRCEDLVQDIFLAAYKNIGRFDPRKGSFRTWLYAIARNRTLNARRKHREDRLPDDAIIADGRTPMDDLVVKEAFQNLDSALNRMKIQDRVIFVLAELEGLAYAEIARIEKLPLGTVKSRLARARAKLRRALRMDKEQPWDSVQTLGNL